MRLLLMVLLTFTLCFSKGYEKELERLSDAQLETLVTSLRVGKDYKMDFILAAIAWKETNFGKIRVNEKDGKFGSYGPHQILLDTFMLRYTHLCDMLGEKAIKHMLTYSDTINAKMAMEELAYWHKRHKGNLTKMLASYNAGNKGINSPRGLAYSKDVQARAKALEKYVIKNDLYY